MIGGPKNFALRLLLIAVFLAVWEGVVRLRIVDPFFTSRPLAIFASFADGVASGDLVHHTAVTSLEMLLGWALGGALGIASGFLLAKFEFLNQVLDPIMYALNGLPRLMLPWFALAAAAGLFITHVVGRAPVPGLVLATLTLPAADRLQDHLSASVGIDAR